VAIVVVVYGVSLALNGFPSKWEAGFQTGVGAITLVMLFAIQHTQSRQQTATQLKLDELIRATPQADSLLVKIEKAEDNELDEREKDLIAQHESLREKPVGGESVNSAETGPKGV
jgi:low affinity Fe/Cu permease